LAGKPTELRGSVSKRRWEDQGSSERNGVKAGYLNRGDPSWWETATGVRALVVAVKRGNSRGAKGGRKVDAWKPNRGKCNFR
jgi:hypothetical protein